MCYICDVNLTDNHYRGTSIIMKFKHFAVITIFTMSVIILNNACSTGISAVKGQIEISAETVQNGIRMSFSDIPDEISRIFIYLSLSNDNPVDGSQMFADIRGSSLELVKQSKNVVCPFVENNSRYSIIAFLQTGNNQESEIVTETTATAGDGIRPINNISLVLNENNSGVILSAPPVFSSGVVHDTNKYMYQATIEIDKTRSIGYGENSTDALSWTFMPKMTEDFKNEGIHQTGDFSAFVTFFCNLVHDNITWMVGVAQTERFTIRL